jgi:integrase
MGNGSMLTSRGTSSSCGHTRCNAHGCDHCTTTEKGGRDHAVLLAPCTQRHIRNWSMYDRHPTPRRYLIPARRDKQMQPISTSFIKKRFTAIAARATPPVVGSHVHIHTTRHTVAVALRMAGRRLVDIQAFLGHRNISTTASVYSLPLAFDLAVLLPVQHSCYIVKNAEPSRPALDCAPPRDHKSQRPVGKSYR